MTQRPVPAIALALAAALGYGMIPPLVRLAYQNGVPALESAFFRSSTLIIGFWLATRLGKVSLKVPGEAWPALVGLSLSTLAVSAGYLASVQFIPVGLAVMIFFTFPVLILVVSPVIEKNRLTVLKFLPSLMAFTGLAVALAPGATSLDWRGLLLAACASLGATCQFFSGRALSRHMPATALGLHAHLILWPMLVVLVVVSGHGKFQVLDNSGVTPTGYLALAALSGLYVAIYFAHMQSLRFAPASIVAPFYNLEPVTTILVATTLLGERLADQQYLGGLLVLAALMLAGLEGSAKRMWQTRRQKLT